MLPVLLFYDFFFDIVLLLLEPHLHLWIGPFWRDNGLTLKAPIWSQVTVLQSELVVVFNVDGHWQQIGIIGAGPQLLSLTQLSIQQSLFKLIVKVELNALILSLYVMITMVKLRGWKFLFWIVYPQSRLDCTFSAVDPLHLFESYFTSHFFLTITIVEDGRDDLCVSTHQFLLSLYAILDSHALFGVGIGPLNVYGAEIAQVVDVIGESIFTRVFLRIGE